MIRISKTIIKSEKYNMITIEHLKKKIPNFAILLSEGKNPIIRASCLGNKLEKNTEKATQHIEKVRNK